MFYNGEVFEDTGGTWHTWATVANTGSTIHATASTNPFTATSNPWTVVNTGLFSGNENGHVIQKNTSGTPVYRMYLNELGGPNMYWQEAVGNAALLADTWSSPVTCTTNGGLPLCTDSCGVQAIGLATSPQYNVTAAAIASAALLTYQPVPVGPGG